MAICNLMIYRDEHGCLTVSPSPAHADPGDKLVFRAFGVTATVNFTNPPGTNPPGQWKPSTLSVKRGNNKGASVIVPKLPMGVYAYSITWSGKCARGNSDPKIIIPR
jgi:hypothetical protein